MKTNKIIVLGSSNTDMVVKTDRLPVPGETILGGTFIMNPGGKGANQAVAAARLGGNVILVSKIGNDFFGSQSIESYNNENIDTQYILCDSDRPSGIALITVDKDGENCIVVASGANATLAKEDLNDIELELISSTSILLMQLEIPIETVEYAARLAKKNNVMVVLNPAPAQYLSDNLLSNVSVLVPNRIEAEILTGIKITDWNSAKKSADILSSKGIEIVIITLGSNGVLLKEYEEYHEIPANKVTAIDTTAAGDAFCGALCVAISEGKGMVEAVRFANKCAGVSVTKMGAQDSIPYRNEI